MQAMMAGGIAAWQPYAVVLDLRGLRYDWGDQMRGVLCATDLPLAVITSDLNREGLTSLVRDELFTDPGDILFVSLSEALQACSGANRRAFKGTEGA